MTRQERVDLLVKRIKRAKNLYYNLDNSGGISDAEYDALEDNLRALDPNNPILKSIGSSLTSTQRKVTLPYPLSSLDKIREDNAQDWLNKYPGPYWVSYKVDGVSLLIIKQGTQLKAYTRGNGSVGQNVSHIIPHLKIGKIGDFEAIRGEIVIKKASFTKWADQFKNARNLVSGIANSKEIHPAIKSLSFIAYEVVAPRGSPSKQMTKLSNLGWEIVKGKRFDTLTPSLLEKFLSAARQSSPYEIDGLVISQDKPTRHSGIENPKSSRAFKSNEGNSADAKVIQVWWTPSRHGSLKPVIEIEPTKLSGVVIKQLTAFNAAYVKEKKLGPGALIRFTRSGDVIPHITEILKPAKVAQLPEGKWKWDGVDIVKVNAVKDNTVLAKRLTFFFSTMGVAGFKQGTAIKFVDAGYKAIRDVLTAPVNKVAEFEGFGLNSATKLCNDIKAKMKSATHLQLMVASGIFGKGFGQSKVATLLESFPNPSLLLKKGKSNAIRVVSELPGWSTSSATIFIGGLLQYVDWYNQLPVKPRSSTYVSNTTEGPLSGKIFCISGVRDAQLQSSIEAKGGKFTNSVNKNTTYLIVKDSSVSTSKTETANKLGVSIIYLLAARKKWL